MQPMPRRHPALFSWGLLTAACLAAAATAFIVAPPAAGPAPPPPQRGTTVLMMAQRHYVKHTRADFLLKSALAVRALCKISGCGCGPIALLVGSPTHTNPYPMP